MKLLAERIEHSAPILQDSSTPDLLRAIRSALKHAADEDVLAIGPSDIYRYVTEVEPPPALRAATAGRPRAIAGGPKDFKRRPESQALVRCDGAWFHFTLTVVENANRPLELVAYDFELVYPDGHLPSFIRFDLNQQGHPNQARISGLIFIQGGTIFSFQRRSLIP